MTDRNRIKRNIVIFSLVTTLCGWLGCLLDQVTGQANYERVGTETSQGTLGMLVWLVTPLFCTILLRSFAGDKWKDAGFAPHFKNNKLFYLISFLIYPVVTMLVLLLGRLTGGIRFDGMKVTIGAYLGILAIQIASQFLKNFFEESVWRGYLTNQLLKLNLSDLKLYLLVGPIWWIWHLPYILIFLSDQEIQNSLPVSRMIFFLIGMVVVTCWTIMYTEIFRITKSIWPLVIAHTMEDAVINPLLLYGIVTVDKSQAFLFSLSVGLIPTLLYLIIGLSIRHWRIGQGIQ